MMELKKGYKRVLNLPSQASAEMVYLPPSSGGAGFLLAHISDLAAVSQAFKLLTSPDPKNFHLAIEGLAASAGQRAAHREDREFLVSYLNGDFPGNSNVMTNFSTARTTLATTDCP